VCAQIPQPLEVESVGGSTWMTVLIASIPAVGALVVVFVGELLQRSRFDDQREADDKRWGDERDLERQRWADAREAEREKQLLTERLRTYASFLAALEDLADAGKGLARAALRPTPQGTLEHFNRLIEALQSDPNDPAAAAETRSAITALRPEAERWTSAYNAAYRTGTQTALIASEPCRNDVVEVLMFVGSLAAPTRHLRTGSSSPESSGRGQCSANCGAIATTSS
jgi:hypothetical protein